ncbi:MAG: Kdo hydroxylase family protein [Methylophilaceae bacterium]
MEALRTVNIKSWQTEVDTELRNTLTLALEQGQVLFFPELAFVLEESEKQFLSPSWLNGSRKNISLDGEKVGGAQGSAEQLAELAAMVARFSQQATHLVQQLFPNYVRYLHQARTSYRPTAINANQAISWKKDDTRLHVDAFPSRPTHGERILRVFANVNPIQEPRVWRVGEPFEATAKRFLPNIKRPVIGSASLLKLLNITKSKRSEYDHIMLHLHDKMKADMHYQETVPQETVHFPPGCVWICFSDQALHAAMSGQFMFEQTFHLPVAALQHPELSPLKVLERLKGRALI